MHRAHKIRLVPTPRQHRYLLRACDASRYAFNWALAEWNRQYAQHRDDPSRPRPSWMALSKQFNAIKHDPASPHYWVTEFSSRVVEIAIEHVGLAWKNYFAGLKAKRPVGRPRFQTRGSRDRFGLHATEIRLREGRLFLNKLCGSIKLREQLRFHGKICFGAISRDRDEWYVSITVDVDAPPATHPHPDRCVGVDLGAVRMAALSDGTFYDLPRESMSQVERRLKRAQRVLSRRWSGKPQTGRGDRALRDEAGRLLPKSRRFLRQKDRVSQLYQKLARIREHTVHHATSEITRNFATIGIEDLTVSRMTKAVKGTGRKAKAARNRAFLNSAPAEFRRQLTYKSEAAGGHVLDVDPAYTSRTCPVCGDPSAANRVSQASFCCVACGYTAHADTNAAVNILAKSLVS